MILNSKRFSSSVSLLVAQPFTVIPPFCFLLTLKKKSRRIYLLLLRGGDERF
jgi:hypothetical protein